MKVPPVQDARGERLDGHCRDSGAAVAGGSPPGNGHSSARTCAE